MHHFIRQWCCTRGRDRSLCTFGKGWWQVPSARVGGGHRQPAWSHRPSLAPGRPPLTHPCQPPRLQAQPCLLWAEPGILAEAPDDSSPSSSTSPPSPISPRARLQSLRPESCPEAGEGSRQLASPTQHLAQGVPTVPPQQANQRAGEQDEVQLHRSPTVPAVPSEPLVGRQPGARPWHGGAQPCGRAGFGCTSRQARLVAGGCYRVRIATG